MWRWLMVMLLLLNALVFFWYAQQQPGLDRPYIPPLPSENRLQLLVDPAEAEQSSP